MSTAKNKPKFQARIAAEIGLIKKQRSRLQKICDELDELLDKSWDIKTCSLLNNVQSCIDFLRDAERELCLN